LFQINVEITLVSTKPTIFYSLLLNIRTRSAQGDSFLADADIPNDRDLHKALHNKLLCKGKVVSVAPMKAYGGAGV
jgi:hypothetical protein